MLCKVISVDGTNVIDGAGPYVMPASAKPMVREFLDNQTSTGALSDTMLLRMQLDLVEYYRDCLEELKSAGPPEVRNTSGEKLVFTTTTYRFEPELRTELIQRLEAMKNITPGELRGPKVVFQWTVEGGRGRTMDGATRATLEVEADRLVCNTNSRERNATITRRLERELSRLLRHEQTTYKTLATALAETAAAEGAPGSGSESDGVLDLDKLSPEDRAALQAVVVEKYMSWADERVPALGGQTPRQAVSTPQGRQKVEDLLADWENRLARMPGHVPFDMNKLRAALGLLGE
ncbi:MAG: DUF2384 domain-containing protein, partial [Candidatus Riflebacteria bacterium]|nr:DUF2384 domain-containing protein [Candidatus Riflebacteria bacterium]